MAFRRDRKSLDGTVNDVDEHTAKHLHRRNGRYFLHLRLSDELTLEYTAEDYELIGQLLREFVHEARRCGRVPPHRHTLSRPRLRAASPRVCGPIARAHAA